MEAYFQNSLLSIYRIEYRKNENTRACLIIFNETKKYPQKKYRRAESKGMELL